MEYTAYLDIETTGLSPEHSELTVIGIFRECGTDDGITQLVGDDISSFALIQALEDVTTIYTYNGARFDLPFIKSKLNVDLTDHFHHKDLMFSCWKRKLYGGLKGVERKLGIERMLPDVNGWVAVQLWHRYINNGDRGSLEKLLKYNEEDVVNLKVLREMLDV